MTRKCLFLAMVLVRLETTLWAQSDFVFMDIPMAGETESVAYGLNDNGWVVGEYGEIELDAIVKPGNRGFVFDGEDMRSIEFPDAVATGARGINSSGQIVGVYRDLTGRVNGFAFDGNTFQTLLSPDGDMMWPNDINNDGTIVGQLSTDGILADSRGFRLGQMFEVVDFPGASTTLVRGTNNAGEIAGTFISGLATSGFVLPSEDVIVHPAGLITEVFGIGDNGQVVGRYAVVSGLSVEWRLFVHDLDAGEFVDVMIPESQCTLGLFSGCSVEDINSSGRLVGFYTSADGKQVAYSGKPPGELRAGDADRDLDFDTFDLVQVTEKGKYLTGEPATWGDGDWNGAPGGSPESPPLGDGFFDQADIVAAQVSGVYLTGPYAAGEPLGQAGDDSDVSVVYHAMTGELSVEAVAGAKLTSINIESTSRIFIGEAASNLGGSFDNHSPSNIFKSTFGATFGSLTFGRVAPPGLDQQFLLSDLSVEGSLDGGGTLPEVGLIYVPEPTTLLLACLGIAASLIGRSRH